MKLNHFLGGILLVSGTTIGAGVLALPVMTGFVGFFPAMAIFALVYLVMLATAFFFLDVNLSLEGEVNFISMAGRTLGRWAQGLNWIFYLLLLYALLAAYIAGSAPLFQMAVHAAFGLHMPLQAAYFCLPVLFAFFVYLGTGGVDAINRLLMAGLGVTYVAIVWALPSHVQSALLTHIDWKPSFVALLVVITSFGYHIIIPSLTTYMHHNRFHLKMTLLIGSLIPLALYIVWELLTLGVVPLDLLATAWVKGEGVSSMLASVLGTPWIRLSVHFFAFFTIVTSFLGVSLSLADFLIDGLKIKKSWEGRLGAIALVFIPPLLFLFSYERGFLLALEYAGAIIGVILILFPALMAWTLPGFYRTLLGRSLLVAVIAFALVVIISDVFVQRGYFKPYLEAYVPPA